jgi:hypothetical protein
MGGGGGGGGEGERDEATRANGLVVSSGLVSAAGRPGLVGSVGWRSLTGMWALLLACGPSRPLLAVGCWLGQCGVWRVANLHATATPEWVPRVSGHWSAPRSDPDLLLPSRGGSDGDRRDRRPSDGYLAVGIGLGRGRTGRDVSI